MANVSAELLWPMVRDTSCFAVKRKVPGRSGMGKAGPRFTTEPNNVSGVNSFKYSGLVNAKTVSLEEAEKAGSVVCARVVLGLSSVILSCRDAREIE
uniref:Large ribosomal subunit protein eL28 n=1 Tax=Seriola lalandi dorsalis TaxID=1841481 RepID=A0A3B4WFS5_SERLL